MAATSPTLAIRSREIIGTDAFSRRREVFGQYDTVFLPSSPPGSPSLDERGQGALAPGFRRTPAYSSMRESRRDDIRFELGFRERKMSDNFSADQEVDYRHSMTERTRRLSKLRRDFLTSNLHEPSGADPFARAGTRASMPLKSPGGTYKVGSGTIYKFPFAEPFSTPPPTRRVFLDLGPVDGEANENKDPENNDCEEVDSPNKHQSLPADATTPVDHHQLFNELLKRYSPQQKPIDWSLPPTKPRVVAALPKSSSTDVRDDQLDSVEDKLEILEDKLEINEHKLEILEPNNEKSEAEDSVLDANEVSKEPEDSKILSNDKAEVNGTLKDSSDELDEKNDTVPELIQISRQNSHEAPIKRNISKDDTIPSLLEKISQEGDIVEKSEKKKVKRKRSFLDKLLNRNKKNF